MLIRINIGVMQAATVIQSILYELEAGQAHIIERFMIRTPGVGENNGARR